MAAPMMTIGCTFDHRLIDGYQAGNLARVVKDSLADPYLAFGLPSRSSSVDGRLVLDQRDATSRHPRDNAYTDHTPESDPLPDRRQADVDD